MTTVLRWSGLEKLLSFYRYLYFNLPRVTTALGITLVLGLGAIHLYLLVTDQALARRLDAPIYLQVYFGLLIATAVLAAAGMVTAAKLGWALGALVSLAGLMMYVASRVWGLPGLPQLVGRWDYALGTFLLALAAGFLAVYFTVLTGLNIAYPQKRNWHD